MNIMTWDRIWGITGGHLTYTHIHFSFISDAKYCILETGIEAWIPKLDETVKINRTFIAAFCRRIQPFRCSKSYYAFPFFD